MSRLREIIRAHASMVCVAVGAIVIFLTPIDTHLWLGLVGSLLILYGVSQN